VGTSPLGEKGSTMSNTHPSYPPEFRSKVVALVRSGRGIREVARELTEIGCSAAV